MTCFPFPISIVKQLNGNVFIYNNDTGDFVKSLSSDIIKIECNENGIVKVIMDNGSVEYFDPAMVIDTQILPASAIPFVGDCLDLSQLFATDFFFELTGGGGGSQNLSQVLIVGNNSGSNDIEFDTTYGLLFDNNSRLRKGTIDAGLGGLNGIAQICGAGYELKWEGGVLYVMGSSGNLIRQSLYNFNNVPTSTDDNTKGYQIGSLWTLDNGNTYVCTDASTGGAIWAIKFFINPIEIQLAASDETTALTTGTNKVTFRTPCAFTLTEVRASLTTAQSSGSIFTVDINENGTSVLSTKLTIDNTEKTSTTALTPAVISDSSLADDSEMTIDIDQIGDGTAKGLKITLIGYR